ncbi:hypothetical protein BS47DRAFT_1353476 [Hydnum rufescens UP504]|uniref:FAS1 domain-containing protein n=1 Tax=Hydnum rufescens UP504 TaxID=1448309 RepID=A0A9P6DP46_9AGAM|nr:hypothetical protein BS47DRAFT_1353476 [Hydnum rufescens UP504]
MRPFVLLTAAAALCSSSALAQSTYVSGLTNYLNSLNLTSFTAVIDKVNGTAAGQNVFTRLASGKPYTLLAPFNPAWSGVNPFFGDDITWLGQTLAYHVIPGTLDIPAIRTSPNHTVAYTLLTDPSLVHLLAGQSQYIQFTKIGGATHISNQNYPSVIISTSTYQNLQVVIISTVVDLPPATSDLLTLASYPQSQELTTLVSLLPPSFLSTLSESPSITFFAPINQAFIDARAAGRIDPSTSPSTYLSLFENHIINGTLVYSGSPQKNYTSAGGQEVTVGTGGGKDGGGSVVYYRGEQVANIVYGDITTQNGVVHLIDVVLPNPASNPAAAASAYSVAVATTTPSPLRRRTPSRLFKPPPVKAPPS